MNHNRVAFYGLPLIAAMGFAPGSTVPASAAPSVMHVALPDDEDDAQLWDEMYWLMDALLWLLQFVEAEQSMSTTHTLVLKTEADVTALANSEISAWQSGGLKPGLSAPQMSQGVVDCDNVLDFIAAHPGMLSASLEGQYVATVKEIRAALLN